MSASPPAPVLSPPSPPGSPRSDVSGAGGLNGISRGFGSRAAELVDGPADGLVDRPANEGTSAVATADIARPRAKTYVSDQDDSDLSDVDSDDVLQPLADILKKDLKLVCCGLRSGKFAMKKRCYWAGEKKDHGYFYEPLFKAGLTDEFHTSEADWTFPARYSIGMTILYDDVVTGEVAYDNINFARPYAATLVRKIRLLRPQVVCILGSTTSKTLSTILHQSTAEAAPGYTLSNPSTPTFGLLLFKIAHVVEAGRADATYFFKVRSPDRQATGKPAPRDAEYASLKVTLDHLENGTFIEPVGMRTANIGPLLRLAATRAAAQARPPVLVQPEALVADRRPRSPSVDEPGSPPPPKRMRATGPSHSPFDPIAGPSGSRESASRSPGLSEPRHVKMEPDEPKIEATETSIKPEPSLGSAGSDDGTLDDKKPALAEVARHREEVKKEKHLADLEPDLVKAEHEAPVKRETDQLAVFD